MSPEWIGALGTVATAIVAFLALGNAWQAIRSQTTNSRLEKVFDALSECHRRYSAVRGQLRRDLGSDAGSVAFEVVEGDEVKMLVRRTANANLLQTQEARAAAYFGEYWSVQMEQWEYFRLGLIPREIFFGWWAARLNDFNPTDSGPSPHGDAYGATYQNGWRLYGKKFFDVMLPEFVRFVEAAANLKTQGDLRDIDSYIGKFSEKFGAGRLSFAEGDHPPEPTPEKAKIRNLAELVAFAEWRSVEHRRLIRVRIDD